MSDASSFRSPALDYDEDSDSLEEDDHGQSTSARGQLYQWQLNDGQQWVSINNDHVIEAHYCQPGAKGITLFTTDYGRIFIDFDKMEVQGGQLMVRRQIFLPCGEMQEMGWYYNDNRRWYEYGSQGSSHSKASVTSRDVEQHYNTIPLGKIDFMAGKFSYSIDFSVMTQTNLTTGACRRLRRRPKLNSIDRPVVSSQLLHATPPAMNASLPPSAGYTWEFMGNEGVWTEYQTPGCSVDSTAVERVYQLNQEGQTKFTAGRQTYTLNFARMCQTNDAFGTQRAVRRTLKDSPQQDSSAGTQSQWQFKDVDGSWRDYTQGGCSVSSQDIERSFQQNTSGVMRFSRGSLHYELDFSAMTQTNLSTSTIREVRRLQQ
ncbi:hypothetical protein AAFF_G00077220 [Aldrovandia affinis]|uniref:WWE domain-containing protein n=1 Tax=Aldrovandia affinis TaxID=143900 RepID=A0AAD7RY72_9TELE|nr:hypothetical protein AAFF_G00077220 [Aldrovandia affinis]